MDGYSRLIAWLRVLLPLMALALLSTMFLLSRKTEPVAAIPFAEADIRNRLLNQQVTGSVFSGVTSSGTQVSLSAAKILTNGGTIGENQAEDISAQFDLVGGARINVWSNKGTVSMVDGSAVLFGDVRITTSDGIVVTSERLEAATGQLDVRSPGPITAQGPFGTLTAGAMALNEPQGQENPHLIFTNGVRLVYEPRDVRK